MQERGFVSGNGAVRLLFVVLFLAGLCRPFPALGQSEAEGKKLSAEGMAAARAGDLDQAVSLWTRALPDLEGEAHLAVHFNLGLAYSRLGKPAQACNHLNLYLRATLEPEPQAVTLVKNLERDLKATHGRVTVVVTPENGTVQFDSPDSDIEIGAPVIWWLSPGEHRVTARAEGYEPSTLGLDIAPGSDARVKLALEPQAALASAPGVATEAKGLDWQRGVQWGLIGTGAAALATAAVLHGIAHNRNETLWQDTYPDTPDDPQASRSQEALYRAAYADDVEPLLTPAWVLYGVGGAMTVAGTIWLLLDDGPQGESGSPVSFSPLATPGQAGGVFTLQF